MADDEPRIISAVGTASGAPKEFAGAAEAAMVAAINKANADGVTEPAEVSQRMNAARKTMTRAIRDAANQAAAEGITDPEEVTARIQAVRDKVMSEIG